MRPNEICEKLLELLRPADDAIVIVQSRHQLNLRFAANTLTTNGDLNSFQIHLIPIFYTSEGVKSATTSRAHLTSDELNSVADLALTAARAAAPTNEHSPLIADQISGEWSGYAEPLDPAQLAKITRELGEEFAWADSAQVELFGYLEQTVDTTWLATSTGCRRHWRQPDGRLELTAKSHGRTRSTWEGIHSPDFSAVNFERVRQETIKKLNWQKRSVELPVGHYEVVAPPSVVADLFTYFMWEAGAKAAQEKRSAFADFAIGQSKLSNSPINFYSDPSKVGIECAPFIISSSSSQLSSIFDNAHSIERTPWLAGGVLTSLANTRAQAAEYGERFSPFPENLIIESTGKITSMQQQLAEVKSGLLLNTLWYIRMLEPSSLLLTGLTRDGVYEIRDGEVVGAVNNFRWNLSPMALLNQIKAISQSEIAQPREWADDVSRIMAPTITFENFYMSSHSPAN